MLGRFAQLLSLLIVFVLTSMLATVGSAQPREILNLDGTWNFATDPGNKGESEKWQQPEGKLPGMPLPGYAPTANGKIQVPGIWDNQGYGVETDKVRHNFVGKGWYKRQNRSSAILDRPPCVSRHHWREPLFQSMDQRAVFGRTYRLSFGPGIRRYTLCYTGQKRDHHNPSGFQATVGSRFDVWRFVAGRLHGRGLGRNLGPCLPGGSARGLAERSLHSA